MMKIRLRAFFLLVFLLINIRFSAVNWRQLSIADGLVNSAVLSLCEDSNGILWIGTLDGLCAYDGYSIITMSKLPQTFMLAGNIIESIIESSPGIIWIQTNYGIDKIILTQGVHESYPQYKGQEKLRSSDNGEVFLLTENSDFSIYSNEKNSGFLCIGNLGIPFLDVANYIINDSVLRVFTVSGIFDFSIVKNGKDSSISLSGKELISQIPIVYAFKNGKESVFAIDDKGNLMEFRGMDTNPVILFNLDEQIKRHGIVSDIIIDNLGDIYVSFLTDGLIKLNKSIEGNYKVENLGLNLGVFCLAKSNIQNVIWAGTDCHGIYTFYDSPHNFQTVDFASLGNIISRPIRSIFYDDEKNLWIGTKGDGILKIENFNPENVSQLGAKYLLNSSNSPLSDNSVYSIVGSHYPIIWIGTEKGLEYYSYKDGKIHSVDNKGYPLESIHNIYERNDSTLIVSTTGNGIFTMKLKYDISGPHLSDITQYILDEGNKSSNYFFSFTNDDNGEIIFSNRGLGTFTIEADSLKQKFNLKSEYDKKSVNDIFSILRDNENVWLGTGNGLLKVTDNNVEILYSGIEDGFLNNTIHSMLKDPDGSLWIGTNMGLVHFNPNTEKGYPASINQGVPIFEFSDGAAFANNETKLFGGVDGLVSVTKNPFYVETGKYMPEIFLIRLTVDGEVQPVHEYVKFVQGKENELRLANNQNYFSLTFAIPDYINGEGYIIKYSLDGNNWINNGSDRTINFTGLRYGTSNLEVKYVNLEEGVESQTYRLKIFIAAPWYYTTFAKIIYSLLITAFITSIILFLLYRQKQRQANIIAGMEQKHKEEVYESKLKFFTNITHEFCTPLTLIYGACERIAIDNDSNNQLSKYTSLIKSNAERLNSLIQDLIDFRKIETGHRKINIKNLDISGIVTDIFNSFQIIADQNNIKFKSEIQPDISFNTDYKSLLRILSNLISNAFKYTPSGGMIKIGMKVENDNLRLNVYNTGKGVSEEEKQKIFNRYSILDNVEENATKGLSARNGLGMAICLSLVEQLDGKIDIESEKGKYADFIVTLPPLPVNNENQKENLPNEAIPDIAISDSEIQMEKVIDIDNLQKSQKNNSILVIDDNRDILMLLKDSLSEYNVVTALNAADGIEELKKSDFDLIITDIMMPGMDGSSLTRYLKGNKHTMHIPLIILSAKNTNAEKIAGLEAGADAYVGKPFHIAYLRALIVRLIENKKKLKEYYNTSASAFEYSNGQLVDKESKEFIDKVNEFIDSNIDDSELTTEQLAEHMQMSVRNLYRKFKDLDLKSPNDFIKQHRITFAAKLLVTTSLTVQEIIYRCGFNNRSHFYREFDKQYGMTPKDYRNANKNKSILEIGKDS